MVNKKNLVIEQAQDIYFRLLQGDVPLEDLLAHPAFIAAQKRADANPRTSDINTMERQNLRHDIAEALCNQGSVSFDNDGKIEYNGIVKNEKRADLVMGLSAAGKSVTLAEPLSAKYKSKIIDCDMAKAMIPEYDNGYGAGAVHRESKDIIETVFERAVSAGENIVYPMVGSNKKNLLEIARQLKENKYAVYLHLNEVPNHVSIKRAAIRFIETGRFISADVIKEYGDLPSSVYEEVKKEDVFDGYSKFDNNVPRGEKARCLENYERPQFHRLENRGNNRAGNGAGPDNIETGHAGTRRIGNSSNDLEQCAIEPLRIYKQTESDILVKMNIGQGAERMSLWLCKEQVTIDKNGEFITSATRITITQHNLQPVKSAQRHVTKR